MPPELDDDHVVAICRVLADHGVEYVIIGGVAARLHQTGHVTVDVDICPSRTEANRARLATASNALGARLRAEGEPNGIAFPAHPRSDTDHHVGEGDDRSDLRWRSGRSWRSVRRSNRRSGSLTETAVQKNPSATRVSRVGRRGLEPLTPCASCKCATSCANGPCRRR